MQVILFPKCVHIISALLSRRYTPYCKLTHLFKSKWCVIHPEKNIHESSLFPHCKDENVTCQEKIKFKFHYKLS